MSYAYNDQIDFELVEIDVISEKKDAHQRASGSVDLSGGSFLGKKGDRAPGKKEESVCGSSDHSRSDSLFLPKETDLDENKKSTASIESFSESQNSDNESGRSRNAGLEACDLSSFLDGNHSFVEHLEEGISDRFYKVISEERANFFNSRIYGLECVNKLKIIPPIRIHELWRRTPLNIREILFNSFFIIFINRVKVWYNSNRSRDILNWGKYYLRQMGEYLVIPDRFVEQFVDIYRLTFKDPHFDNFADLTPLKETLNSYFLFELQPKLDSIYSECRSYHSCSKGRDSNSDYESFVFIRNVSADNIPLAKDRNKGPESERIGHLSMSLSDISLDITPDKDKPNRRNTWSQDTNTNYKDYYSSEKPPPAALIFVLSLFRLHAIDGILNSRTITILIDIYGILIDRRTVTNYASSLLVFDCLQMLTCNDTKRNKLKGNTCSLDKGWNKSMRYLKIAGVTLLGGAVLAAATTIAAPGIVAGLGTLGVTFSGIFGGSVSAGASTATLSAVAGVSGAGLSGWKMSRRESPLKVFAFHQVRNIIDKNGSFPILIGVSGWLRDSNDIFDPWKAAFNGVDWTENYVIEFEPDVLSRLGVSIALTMSQDLAIFAGKAILLQTVVGTLTAALSWPLTLMQYAATLDNTWAVTRQKTEQAAVILADALCDNSTTGNRPVKLIGYSMGARLIFLTLQILYDRKQYDKVQDVVLLGMPSSLNKKRWNKARSVVSNRFVNVFTRSDWVLAFFYRYMQWGLHVAGISPANFSGVENYDVTGLINSHEEYPGKIRDILYYVKFF